MRGGESREQSPHGGDEGPHTSKPPALYTASHHLGTPLSRACLPCTAACGEGGGRYPMLSPSCSLPVCPTRKAKKAMVLLSSAPLLLGQCGVRSWAALLCPPASGLLVRRCVSCHLGTKST